MFTKATKFESLLEAVPNALVGMGQDGTIRFVNHQTERLFGYDRDELIGLSIDTLVPEHLWQIYLEHRETYFADPRTRSMGLDLSLSARHRDGEDFPVNLSLSSIDTGDVLLEITALLEVNRQRQAATDAQRMTAIVEHSDDAILLMTVEGLITSWNPAASRMYGYEATEAVGKHIELLERGERDGEMAGILARIRGGESIHHWESTRVRKDDSLIACSLSISPILDDDNRVIAVSCIARDVTKRHTAFEAARAMIEASQDSLVSISAEGRITDANEATVTITGVPREELIGSDFTSYFTKKEKATELFHRVFSQDAPTSYSMTICHRDGTLTDVVYNASAHRNAVGEVLGVFAAARDVTDLKRSLDSARAMIESSLDLMVSISPEGMITDVNEATTKITGAPRDQLIGTAFSDYFTEPQEVDGIYERVFAGAMLADYPLTMRDRNGKLTEVMFNATVHRDTQGNVLGVFASARDVTAQQRAERQLNKQRAVELERLTELESFHKLTVSRELKMIELKKENEHLRRPE